MSAQKKEEQINLLPRKGFESSTSGRILAWILSTFRIIVIVTEIIVMVAFLSRFWFDAQNSDLNEKIQQKQAILSASQEFEIRFKDVQKRLEVYKNLTQNKSLNSEIIGIISISTPPDIILDKLSVNSKVLEITGTTPNEASIQQLIVNLADKQKFKEVGLAKTSTSPENPQILIFTIVANVSSQGGV